MEKITELYDRIVDKDLTVRRMYVVANHVIGESDVSEEAPQTQITMFDDPEELERKTKAEKAALEKERRIQKAAIEIKKKFGKNAVLKGMNLEEGATTVERNKSIGGHRSGE